MIPNNETKNLISVNFALDLKKGQVRLLFICAHTNNLHEKMHYRITHSNWHFSGISFVPGVLDPLLRESSFNMTRGGGGG